MTVQRLVSMYHYFVTSCHYGIIILNVIMMREKHIIFVAVIIVVVICTTTTTALISRLESRTIITAK